MDPHTALRQLLDGNRRFVQGSSSYHAPNQYQRQLQADGQHPFAIILGCSDSRVPAELVLDQGFGDLFVIRVAGNIVAASQMGSVEFAVELFQTRLVVVLGHTGCGAVVATVDQLISQVAPRSHNIASIVKHIRPALETMVESMERPDKVERSKLIQLGVRANIHAAVNQLRYASPLLESKICQGKLLVVGAEYSLNTGKVEFLDSPE